MKYGKLSLLVERFETINYGDVLQDFACDYLYESIGVGKEDIIEIPFDKVCEYDGEYVVAPVYNAMLDAYFEPSHFLSPKIIPVFLGLVTDLVDLPEDMVSYLKQYEPIGCRDEYTLRMLRRYQIRAYMGGCITTILPKRKEMPKRGKVFFTDIPEALASFIPESLKNNSEFITQIGNFPYQEDEKKRRDDIKRAAKAFYQRYADEAALLVTSRLHSTLPCLAMGIPVVLARDEMWKTFMFVDAYLPVYTKENYKEIDWDPHPVDYELLKEKILCVFQSRLKKAYDDNKEILEVSEFYENRKKSGAGLDFLARLDAMVQVLRENWACDERFTYIIWGAGIRGHMARGRIAREFPNAKLVAYIDSVKQGKFDETNIIKPEELGNYPDAYIVICNNTGEGQAMQKMKELGKKENVDYISTNIR